MVQSLRATLIETVQSLYRGTDMIKSMLIAVPLCGVFITATGCSPQSTPANVVEIANSVENIGSSSVNIATPVSPVDRLTNPSSSTFASANLKMLTLDGFGGLKIGKPVPDSSSWAERGAQISGTCRTVSSPDYPGAYAVVVDDRVQRISLGQRSKATLAEGIGVGAREADVRKWFAGFREEPHKYEEAPAKYLTAPNVKRGLSALRFEIGHDSTVKMIHVGMMPALAYVEGCA